MLTYVRTGTAGGIFIQIMQINNKNVYKIHNTYAVLYTQSPLASVGNVSPERGDTGDRHQACDYCGAQIHITSPRGSVTSVEATNDIWG
jgi:predicted aconitase with swiveling domain